LSRYSSSQKLLHIIALSSSFLREAFFDLEKSFFLNEDFEIDSRHVFISGMARSGTTILLNAIYETNEFASLTYKDMPFILSPNIWSKLSKNNALEEKQERAHNDGIKIDTNSPEAFEEVFWKTFDDSDSDSYKEFKYFVQLLCLKYKKKRYLSKNNQNIKRINHLINNYPNSKIIVPFREPLQHSFSLFTQHKKFISLQKNDKFIRKYMSLIGHSEFGLDYIPQIDKNLKYSDTHNIDHWLEQWYLTHNMFIQFLNSSQVLFVCYEELCKNHFFYKSILDFIDINFVHDFNFSLSKKEINLEYDSDLYNKCLESYNKLKIQM